LELLFIKLRRLVVVLLNFHVFVVFFWLIVIFLNVLLDLLVGF
jgi:hypothetical protein